MISLMLLRARVNLSVFIVFTEFESFLIQRDSSSNNIPSIKELISSFEEPTRQFRQDISDNISKIFQGLLHSFVKNKPSTISQHKPMNSHDPELTCPVCQIYFDDDEHAPLVYPCTAVYCRQCVIQGLHHWPSSNSEKVCFVHRNESSTHSLKEQRGWRNIELPHAIRTYLQIKANRQGSCGDLQALKQDQKLKEELEEAREALVLLFEESKTELSMLLKKEKTLRYDISKILQKGRPAQKCKAVLIKLDQAREKVSGLRQQLAATKELAKQSSKKNRNTSNTVIPKNISVVSNKLIPEVQNPKPSSKWQMILDES